MKKLVDVNKDRIKELHAVATDIVLLLDRAAMKHDKLKSDSAKKRNRKTIHILNQALEYTELQLQKEWGFDQDVNKHTWWLKPKSCTCPKLDNTDPVYFGGGKIISSDCPIHSYQVASSDNYKILEDMQKLEIEADESPTSSAVFTGYFSNHRLSYSEIPKGMYRYQLRHKDSDDSCPYTLEPAVCVNHFGDFLVFDEIDFMPVDGCYIIKDYSFIHEDK